MIIKLNGGNGMSISSNDIVLEDVLILIEESLKATTTQALRQSMVYGVGALMDSVSCVWTEVDTDLFKEGPATTTIADINKPEIDVPSALVLFNQYAYQHPIIEHIIKTDDDAAFSISDKLSRKDFNSLDLYQRFYKTQNIEDQMTVGYVDDNNVKSLLVNRTSWGFSDQERCALTHIARCVFPFYRLLKDKERKTQQPPSLVTANINNIMLNSDHLGLTFREAELLTHVAQGKCNKQIADVCCISEGTVRKHLENAYRRLQVNNRICAVLKCIEKIQHVTKAI